MIFKNLFRPKHQHPDAKVRVQAIATLSAQDPQQKTLLHELAFNDDDPRVSLAALNKLDNFTLWYKMAEIGKDARVNKKAQQIVEEVLLHQDQQRISDAEKRTCIMECKNIPLLEKLVRLESLQQSDPSLVLNLLKRLDKPLINKQIFFATESADIQLALLDGFNEEAELQKIVKKASAEAVKQGAQTKLDQLLLDKEKPLILDKQVRMLLSRLLALKDNNDYAYVSQQRDLLGDEFIELQKQFNFLDLDKIEEFTSKFSDINKKIFSKLAALKPQWQEQHQQQERQQQIAELSESVQLCLGGVTEKLRQDLAALDADTLSKLKFQIEEQLQKVRECTSHLTTQQAKSHSQLEVLYNQLLACQSTLDKIPAFQMAVEQGETFLNRFMLLSPPSDVSQLDAASDHLQDLKQQWGQLRQEFAANWPRELTEQWEKGYKAWQSAIKSLRQSIQQDVSRCRDKLRAIDKLVEQGKFRAAIALFNTVSSWYQALPEKQQEQMARTFDKAKGQIENLKDWQAYIALPRKPALLDEALQLASDPKDIKQQAEQVKALRSEWNSLGKLNTEADDALNVAFEQAIESAFAPCREHYAQQQQQREMNLAAKQTVLAKLNALNEQPMIAAELARQIDQIQQEWKGIGEVEYSHLAELNHAYLTAIDPLRKKINAYYDDNAVLKQNLLSKAEKLLELDNLAEAAEQAKKLQQEWKGINSAGRRADGQLWSAFRDINDKLFAKRKEQYQQVKDAEQQQVSEINAALKDMKAQVTQAEDKSSLSQALDKQSELLEQISQLPERQRGAMQSGLADIVTLQQQKLSTLQDAQHKQKYVDLFDLLESWKTELPQNVENLPQSWQQWFKVQENGEGTSRQEITLKMELVADKESPAKDAELRKALQMQLMAAKLQDGEELNLEDLLKQWIQQGPLDKNDVALLARVKAIFIS
jgi:DNA repair protein SbcC/Rad50